MVHVKKCPSPHGRGAASIEFYKDGKPQKYCMGWVDSHCDEPLEECTKCADWVNGEQCEKDFEEARGKNDGICEQRMAERA